MEAVAVAQRAVPELEAPRKPHEVTGSNLYGGHRQLDDLAFHKPFVRDLRELRNKGIQTLGIFGGTFDPVHEGHLSVANTVADKLGLDAVLYVPTRQNPLKDNAPGASGLDRLGMLCSVLRRDPRGFVSDIELMRDEPVSYTIDTVREIAQALHVPGELPVKLVLILGEDNLEGFERWKGYREIGRLAQVVFNNRGAVSNERLSVLREKAKALGLEQEALIIERETPEISSTGIRQALRSGCEMPPGMLPAVANYLRKRSQGGAAVYA